MKSPVARLLLRWNLVSASNDKTRGPRSLSEIDFDSYQGKAADCSAAGGCSY